MGNKVVVIATSAGSIAGGVALMIQGGPVGIVAGGALVGTGISGGVITFQLEHNDNDEFDDNLSGMR